MSVVALLTAHDTAAQFAPPVSTLVGPEPNTVASGDFDGDGDLDVVAPIDPSRLVFLFNDGSGVLGGAISVQLGTEPHAVVAANLDGDTDIDVAVSLPNAGQVRVLLNDGTGTFSAGALVTAGTEPLALRAGNLNGGALDLVVANRSSNSLTVMLNNGNATFTTATVATGEAPVDLFIDDLNGDADADVAVAVHDARRIELYANDGSGVLAPASAITLDNLMRPSGIAGADLDGDHDTDLVASVTGGGQNGVAMFECTGAGAGAGAFATPDITAIPGQDPRGIAVLDVDIDNDADVVTANLGTDNVTLVFNDGLGDLSGPLNFAVGDQPGYVAVANMDGEGADDLLVANEISGNVSVLMNLEDGDAFENLGAGLAGTLGIPSLTADGTLEPGSPVTITLTGAAPGALSILFIGLSAITAPFKGGTLVPAPDVPIPFVTGPTGGFEVSDTWPQGIPPDTRIFLQIAVSDAGAVQGVALSNALKGTTP